MTSFTKKLGVFAFALSLALAAPIGTLSAADDVATLMQRSYDLEGTAKYADSLAALDQLPAANQATFVVQLRRGWLLYLLGRYEESATAYQKATGYEPAAIEARLGASRSLLALRKWSDAEKECREVLARDATNYFASSRLAFALYNQGRFADALGHYKKMVELYPSDVDMRNGVGWSQIKLGDAAAAVKAFRAVLDIAPRNASAQEGLKAAGVTK